jgi:hypothetical protein
MSCLASREIIDPTSAENSGFIIISESSQSLDSVDTTLRAVRHIINYIPPNDAIGRQLNGLRHGQRSTCRLISSSVCRASNSILLYIYYIHNYIVLIDHVRF